VLAAILVRSAIDAGVDRNARERAMTQETTQIRIAAERSIAAPAAALYGYIADYRAHHPNFLPPAFSNLAVEQGGVGEGTVIAYDLKVGGRTRRLRAQVTEPQPGRVLQETDLVTGAVTTFEVLPEGATSRVRIRTIYTPKGGLQGWIERRLAPRLLGKLYADELAGLDHYARQQSGDAPAA
jgi:hypothetical protein